MHADSAEGRPESPNEVLDVLQSVEDVAKALGLNAIGASRQSFFDPSPSLPTFAEGVLLALALLYSSNNTDELYDWQRRVLQYTSEFGSDGAGWTPPAHGDWQRPSGPIFDLITSMLTDGGACAAYGEALFQFGAVTSRPPHGTLKKYFSKLRSGDLKVQRPKRQIGRAPFICVHAARLLRSVTSALYGALGKAAPRATRARPMDEDPELLPWLERSEHEQLKWQLEQLQLQHAKLARTHSSYIIDKTAELEALGEQMDQKIFTLATEVATVAAKAKEERAQHVSEVALLEAERAAEREQHDAELARAIACVEQLRARSSRGYTKELEAQVAQKEAKVKELSARRANNMAATKMLNLEHRRNHELKRANDELRESITTNWGKDTLELAEAAREIPCLETEVISLKAALAEAEEEIRALRRVVFPPPPMERGAFEMPLRFMVMKLIALANMCHTRVPIA